MKNKKQHARTLLGLAIVSGLVAASSAQAGGFATPTFGAEGWGRAFGGGSMFKDDPSSAYNNPAAMAFIDHNVAQFNIDYARINIKYKGTAKDYAGNDPAKVTLDPVNGTFDSVPRTGDGGQAKASGLAVRFALSSPLPTEQYSLVRIRNDGGIQPIPFAGVGRPVQDSDVVICSASADP